MITTLIRKFRGLKTVKEAKSLADEDCADIQNFTIRNGLLQTRPGYFKFNNTALSGAITGLYDYKPRWGRFFLTGEGEQIRSETVLNANFVGAPMMGNAPLTVYFFDITLDWDDEITGWHWWYGDGDEGTTQFPTHIYTTPGLYTVKLEVSTAYASFTKKRVNYIRVLDPDDPDIDDSYGGDEEYGVGGMNHIYMDFPQFLFQIQGTYENGEVYKTKIYTDESILIVSPSLYNIYGMMADGHSLWLLDTNVDKLKEYDFNGTLLNDYDFTARGFYGITENSIYSSKSDTSGFPIWWIEEYDKEAGYVRKSDDFSISAYTRMGGCSDGKNLFLIIQAGNDSQIWKFNSVLSSYSVHSLNRTESSRRVYGICTDGSSLFVLMRRWNGAVYVESVEKWSTLGVNFYNSVTTNTYAGLGNSSYITADTFYFYISNYLLDTIRQYTQIIYGTLVKTWSYPDSRQIWSV